MKIGMMAAWNQDAGPSINAELIGREWVRQGHEVRIFSFIPSDIHGKAIVGKDEEYVFRCFSTRNKGYLEPKPILEFAPDLFIVQDLGMLPMDEFAKVFSMVKKTAKTVNVIHDCVLSNDPSFYQFEWDKIVCFDNRYKDFLKKLYNEEIITIIPHPCNPWNPGNKEEARKKLDLSLDGYILFVFGQKLNEKLWVINSLKDLSEIFDLSLLIVSLEEPVPLKRKDLKIYFRKEAPDIKRLYDYLYAVDALIVNKEIMRKNIVISTTAFQCLGSGCPILAYASRLVEEFSDDVIIKYKVFDELEEKLKILFEDEEFRAGLQLAQKDFVERYSPDKIAEAYLKLFN